ncbi:MAG: hypothetical protein P1U34_01000 [Coxiellaceae bacterium]|nr:hypothetical protein [Coxiellaceae bacterium]
MKKLMTGIVSLLISQVACAHSSQKLIHQMKSMFSDIVINKHINAIPKYYTKDFVLQSNGKSMNLRRIVSCVHCVARNDEIIDDTRTEGEGRSARIGRVD